MAGLYLHIPFCKRACHYCNFHFSTSLQLRKPLVDALCRELELRRAEIPGGRLSTIYLGGGTPSLLTGEELQQIFRAIDENYTVAAGAEITLEANPDDLGPEKLQQLRDSPVNRLSIGIQSFSETDLQFMNRAHTAAEAAVVLDNAVAAGFQDLTVDLIYGSPTTSDQQWRENVSRVLDFGVPHLSCYALTVEPRTALHHFIQQDKAPAPDEEKAARQFLYLMEAVEAAGYEHYEISNIALPGRYSRHNTNYWRGVPYLGVGPSAHSYNGADCRSWNIAHNPRYIEILSRADQPGQLPGQLFELEVLSPADHYNEYVMTSLRTRWGAELSRIADIRPDLPDYFVREAQPHLQAGHLRQEGEAFMLTRAGKLLADGVASDMFWVE